MTARQKIFVIGARRSGTTWTLSLLSQHPSIVGVLHTNFIRALRDLNAWWERSDPYHNTVLLADDEVDNLRKHITEDEFYRLLRQVCDAVLDKAFIAKPTAQYLVESQPENIEYLPLIRRMYPDARILHVIRDPRAVYSSWKAAARTWSSRNVFGANPVRFCHRWRREIEAAKRFSSDSETYRVIRYMDLKDFGPDVLLELYDWLGLPRDKELAKASIDACDMQRMRKRKIMPDGFFRSGRKTGWKSELGKSEIKCIEYLLHDLMEEFGYERTAATGSPQKPFVVRKYEFLRRAFHVLQRIAPRRFADFLKRSYVG